MQTFDSMLDTLQCDSSLMSPRGLQQVTPLSQCNLQGINNLITLLERSSIQILAEC
jgi:hypothetical protein